VRVAVLERLAAEQIDQPKPDRLALAADRGEDGRIDTSGRALPDAEGIAGGSGIQQQPQVAEGIHDLRSSVEGEAGGGQVRHVEPGQRLADLLAVPVGRRQDADRRQRHAVSLGQGRDSLGDPLGLAGDALRHELLDRLANGAGGGGGQASLAALERAGEGVGGLDQGSGGAMVVGQADFADLAKIGPEARFDQIRRGAAPLVDRLIEVAEQREVAGPPGQRRDDLELGEVGVLDLVNLHEVVASGPVVVQVRVGGQDRPDVEHEVGEVEALPLVEAALVLLGGVAQPAVVEAGPRPG